jgi:hypothetical protein
MDKPASTVCINRQGVDILNKRDHSLGGLRVSDFSTLRKEVMELKEKMNKANEEFKAMKKTIFIGSII